MLLAGVDWNEEACERFVDDARGEEGAEDERELDLCSKCV